MSGEPEDTAVFQMEVDRKRWNAMTTIDPSATEMPRMLRNLAAGLARDTLLNGGTLVIVADDEKVTFVQRPHAPAIDKIKGT